MPVIKPTCVRDLKLRVNIADVVSRVATLKRSGSRLRGLCPFHSEKTPSFYVNLDRGSYKCFGCGKSGDAIEFVREGGHVGFISGTVPWRPVYYAEQRVGYFLAQATLST